MITNWTKSGIMPQGAEYWHAIENGVAADYSGNGRHLSSTLNYPQIVSNVLGKNSAYYFDGTKDPLTNSTSQTIKHIFIVAKFQGDTFSGSEGLLTDISNNIPVLVGGGSGTNIFFNNSQGVSYRKNNVPFAENAMSAPVSGWALMEVQLAAGLPMQGWQIGRDRADNTRRWNGYYAGNVAFNRILSANDRRRAIFFYNLQFGAYFSTPITLEFPDPTITDILYARFAELPPDWDEITVSHKYQDGGKSFNETADAPPKRWEAGFTGLSYDEMRIFDEFDARVRRTQTFDFTDKWGEKHSGVRIESYERTHEAHKSNIYEVRFKLAQY